VWGGGVLNNEILLELTLRNECSPTSMRRAYAQILVTYHPWSVARRELVIDADHLHELGITDGPQVNLADPDLSPTTVAAANHVSVRYLHRLFETHETTVAAWIRGRRFERSRRDLADPTMRQLPISAIAARWGLTNPAHFGRLFRTEYGLQPTEYRRETQQTPHPA
jgi:AraC-like DNA-binding protein